MYQFEKLKVTNRDLKAGIQRTIGWWNYYGKKFLSDNCQHFCVWHECIHLFPPLRLRFHKWSTQQFSCFLQIWFLQSLEAFWWQHQSKKPCREQGNEPEAQFGAWFNFKNMNCTDIRELFTQELRLLSVIQVWSKLAFLHLRLKVLKVLSL